MANDARAGEWSAYRSDRRAHRWPGARWSTTAWPTSRASAASVPAAAPSARLAAVACSGGITGAAGLGTEAVNAGALTWAAIFGAIAGGFAGRGTRGSRLGRRGGFRRGGLGQRRRLDRRCRLCGRLGRSLRCCSLRRRGLGGGLRGRSGGRFRCRPRSGAIRDGLGPRANYRARGRRMHHGHVERLEFGVFLAEHEGLFEVGLGSRQRRGCERMTFLRRGRRRGLGAAATGAGAGTGAAARTGAAATGAAALGCAAGAAARGAAAGAAPAEVLARSFLPGASPAQALGYTSRTTDNISSAACIDSK